MRGAPPSSLHGRRQDGVALLMASLLGVALLGGWLLAWNATHDTVRAERFLLRRAERADFVARALADGVRLLETGLPPGDPYECVVSYPSSPRPVWCKITYASLGGADWEVDVRLASTEEVLSLPSLPLGF